MSITVTAIHHTSFTVSNLEEAERFFVELFGLERVGGGTFEFDNLRKTIAFPDATLKIAYLIIPGTTQRLELIEYVRPAGAPTDTATNRPGNAHMCFEVSDIHAEYARLCDRGVKFKSSPNQILWGANRGGWGVYFNGPDRIALELIQPGGK